MPHPSHRTSATTHPPACAVYTNDNLSPQPSIVASPQRRSASNVTDLDYYTPSIEY